MENTNRSVFALNGATGMLIATVLLLSILAILTYFGILAQQDVAQKPYKLDNPSGVQMKSTSNSKHIVIKE
ncbi:DUF4006 family protein [Campylobacter sp. faydin G-24]|uniref:DUF4006 family protein n=1 Tax=Campylobacter anatolicus TaxID=2829105 RepID=A0ABS5HGS3_9BACT|nr:DUF4006 family protein [Campylobacter anatolicus]MBR8461746.1 DUF4006 family protein [Campylobacter anatolicus]MBR8463481.1 DUF4006 family protein [Campylobacter anatolicus]MBR8465166.1 DUF4006 family protein [Campylobacter anatolicus]